MKYLILFYTVVIGAIMWHAGAKLSSDAISMALGVFFGVLAGLPVALLVMASNRRGADQTRQAQRDVMDHYERQWRSLQTRNSDRLLTGTARYIETYDEDRSWEQ